MGALALAKPEGVSVVRKGLALSKNFLEKNSQFILTGTGIIGIFTTAVIASKDTVKATKLIEEAETEKGEHIDTVDKAKLVWKCYIPTAISVGLTVGAVIAGCAISEKKRAALAGLYALSETALKDYQQKVEETYGPKKEQAIRDAVNSDKVADRMVDPEALVGTSGMVMVLDKWTGRMKPSTPDIIQKAANDISQSILCGDMCASLNEFYGLVGWDGCKVGDECGWNIGHLCKPYFTSALTSDMKPVLVLDWDRDCEPIVTYREI